MKTRGKILSFRIIRSSWTSVIALAGLLGAASFVSGQSAPVITLQPVSQAVPTGSNATFTVGVTGTGPFTYQWVKNRTINMPQAKTIVTNVAVDNNYYGDSVGIAVDKAGCLYFSEQGNSCIRKLDTNRSFSTVAGIMQNPGYSGDGGAATNTMLNYPMGIAMDKTGNLFIADDGNNRIRKMDTNGIITTVAGNGVRGYSGDGGAATNASIQDPFGIAVDSAGSLYFPDPITSRVRKVDTNGIITTIAGNGGASFSGDGAAATNASLNSPYDVAVDRIGNLYIADTGNNRVRKVDTNGIITTVAGNGTTSITGDGGLATNAGVGRVVRMTTDDSGNLYTVTGSGPVATYTTRKVDTNGIITTALNNSAFRKYKPGAITTDTQGNLFFIETYPVFLSKAFNDPSLKLTNVTADATYSVIVSSAFGSVTSSVVTLSVGQAPSILAQPTNQQLAVAAPATFSVQYSGTEPLSFQWQHNGTNLSNGSRISGVDTANLQISSLEMSDAGNYCVVLTNAFGNATSSNAVLAVTDPPVITKQPIAQATSVGMPVNLSVEVSGAVSLTYQWQHNGTNLPQSVITTVAGGYFADLCPATNANLALPSAVVKDNGGNIYIADVANNRIRMVDASGMITTVAGNGSQGFSGDGGPAINASLFLSWRSGLAVDNAGNLFIADFGNHRVRKVDINGTITTIAGSGTSFPFVDNCPATNASLLWPSSLAMDRHGNLYVADFGDFRVRVIGTNGIITTVAGNGSSYPPSGDGIAATNASLTCDAMTVDDAGNLYVIDSLGKGIRKVDTNGIINTIAGNGAAGSYIQGICVDSAGNIFAADSGSNRVCKVDTNGIISTVAGNGSPAWSGDGVSATNSGLSCCGISLDNAGNLFIADQANSRIRKVDANGIITTVAGNGLVRDNMASLQSSLATPNDVAVDNTGNFYIADTLNSRIRKISTNGVITTIAGSGIKGFSGDGGPAIDACLSYPTGIALDDIGNLYFGDNYGRVRKVDTNGIITTVAGKGITSPYSGGGGAATNASFQCNGVTVDNKRNFYIVDYFNYRILKVDTNGIIMSVAGTGLYSGSLGDGSAATSANVKPSEMTVDSVGNLYIVDSGNVRIRKVGTNGIITTIAGNGTSGYSGDGGPATSAKISPNPGVTVDNTGNVYISDASRVRKIGTNGIITTVAGYGASLYSGDGGAATNAGLSAAGLALDGAGNLLIADSQNNRIRKVTFAAPPTWTIPSAGVQDAGDYSVIISNSFGSITSSVVSLVLAEAAPVVNDTTLTNQIVMAGVSTTLSANASGSLLSYQWLFNGNVMTSATNAFLTLRNVTTNQSGLYSVIVSNTISTASREVQLLVVPALKPEMAPQLASSALQSGKFNLHFSTLPGYRYIVQCSDSLTATNWTTIKTLPADFTPGSIDVLTDVTNAAQFYRVIIAN